MKIYELEHIIRAAGAITGSKEIIVIGSQAILGFNPKPPAELLVSIEADVWPADDPLKADLIDGCIGEMSPFHDTFGYYAHGIGPETAKLPRSWRDRVCIVSNENTNGYSGLCIHPIDLAISKMYAGREKDLSYVKVLIQNLMVDIKALQQIAKNELNDSDSEILHARLNAILG
jgi:hypothetical protein